MYSNINFPFNKTEFAFCTVLSYMHKGIKTATLFIDWLPQPPRNSDTTDISMVLKKNKNILSIKYCLTENKSIFSCTNFLKFYFRRIHSVSRDNNGEKNIKTIEKLFTFSIIVV